MARQTADEIRRKTAELLGVSEDRLTYITQEMVDADAARSAESAGAAEYAAGRQVLYGSNVRYGAVQIGGLTYQAYWYEYGGGRPTTDMNLACGTARTFWLRMDQFDHDYVDKCPSGWERWRFTSK